MKKPNSIAFLLIVLLTIYPTYSQECGQGEIYRSLKCVNCHSLPHVDHKSSMLSKDACPCVQGYKWSAKTQECLIQTDHQAAQSAQIKQSQLRREFDHEDGAVTTKRLLANGCDSSKGFILKNGVCVSCLEIPHSIGLASDDVTCRCQNRYFWFDYYQVCQCYFDTGYLYYNGNTCNGSCNLITNQSLKVQCDACTGATFGYNRFGCFNCSSILNGVSGNGLGSCICKPGYTFLSALGKCACSATGYFQSGANCLSCSGLDPSLVSACTNCLAPNFIKNGYICVPSSAILNIVASTGACPSNYALSKSPVTNEIIKCVCSAAAGFYSSGSQCLSCSTQPIPGIPNADCISCNSARGFYKAAIQCIYCPNSPSSTGTASINGCGCRAGQYWNAINSRCQCNWGLGFIGQPGSCINCSALANTENNGTIDSCICERGYKWTASQCVCDNQGGSFFNSSQVCINCFSIMGAKGTVANGNSCVCIAGYAWNFINQICVCDYLQNFYVISGLCRDCATIINSNGFATSTGCGCIGGYVWQESTMSCVGCSSGFVSINGVCQNCSTAALPSGATLTGCQACNNAEGFAFSNGICLLCTSNLFSTGTATSNSCNCKDSTMNWYAPLQTCGCYFFFGYLSSFSNGQQSCQSCSTLGLACTCQGPNVSYKNGICTACSGVPNSNGSSIDNGDCACSPGYSFSSAYPYTCLCSLKSGGYLDGVCKNCSTLSATGAITQNGCLVCDSSQGFLLIPTNSTCILCSSLPNTSGKSSLRGCECKVGVWDPNLIKCVVSSLPSCPAGSIRNPITQTCVCDSSLTIINPQGGCIFCSSVAFSRGKPENSYACLCISGYVWIIAAGSLGSCKPQISGCDTKTSASIGSICIACSSVPLSTGVNPANSSQCLCPSGFSWQFFVSTNSAACVCNSSIALSLSGNQCFSCKDVAFGTGLVNATNSNACSCLPGLLFIWDAINSKGSCQCPSLMILNAAKTCVCDSTVAITLNGGCSKCSQILYSTGVVLSMTICECKPRFSWDASSFSCKCNLPFVINSGVCGCPSLQILNSNGVCVCDPSTTGCLSKCSSDPLSTGVTLAGSICQCLPLVSWNQISGKCECNSTSILITSDNNAMKCIPCDASINANGRATPTSCKCINANLVWSSISSKCECKTSNSVIFTGNRCVTCNISINSIASISSTSCSCIDDNFVWKDNTGCVCKSDKAILISASGVSKCLICDETSNANGIASASACKCLGTLTWVNGTCGCGTNSVITKNNTCVPCSASIYAASKMNATTCFCLSGILTWLVDTYTCGCPDPNSMVISKAGSFSCLVCNSSIYSSGLQSGVCKCFQGLAWQPAFSICDCGQRFAIFQSGEKTTCINCVNNSLGFVNKATSTSCSCVVSVHVWQNTTGTCDCPNMNNTVTVGPRNAAKCITCGPNINALQRADTLSCTCISSNLTWQAAGYCDCGANKAFYISGSNYICVDCTNPNYQTQSKLNSTTCACITKLLVWYPSIGICDCQQKDAVIIFERNIVKCVTCNETTFAAIRIDSYNCQCISSNLTWQPSGICDCGDSKGIWIYNPITYICITCGDSSYSVNKANASHCNCVSKALVWKTSLGSCDCPDSDNSVIVKTITGTATNYKCVTCNDTVYSSGRAGPEECICRFTEMIWNTTMGKCDCSAAFVLIVYPTSAVACLRCSSEIYAVDKINTKTCSCIDKTFYWTGDRCSCRDGSILLPEAACLACPSKTTIGNYTCSCTATSKTSMWNDINKKCIACGTNAIPNSNPTSSGISCTCKAGFIWDVMTNACIKACNSGTCTMNCGAIPNINPAFTSPLSVSSVTVKNLLDGDMIASLLNTADSNYAAISDKACTCIDGFLWDSRRLRCMSSKLN